MTGRPLIWRSTINRAALAIDVSGVTLTTERVMMSQAFIGVSFNPAMVTSQAAFGCDELVIANSLMKSCY